jgi:hypothetical protein
MKINSSSINKNNTLTLLILISLLTTIIVRLDFIIPVIRENLSYELELTLRLTSGVYSVISIFLIIISTKSFTVLTIRKNNKSIEIDNKTYYLYIFYYAYFLMVNFILYFINYKSISSLNIDYLVLVFYLSSLISSIIGLYYVFYKFEFKLDLNKTLSSTGKICLLTFLIIYLSLFIGLRTGYLINFLENNFFLNKILCESTNNDINNLLNNMKDPNQDKITSETRYNFSNARDITNNANSESVVGNTQSLVVGQGSTVSNVIINPSQISAGISSTATSSRITTYL